MRSISELLSMNNKVWFYFSDEEWKKRFEQEGKTLGLHFSNGTPMEKAGMLMSVNSEMQAAYISMFIWELSFGGNVVNINSCIKVDYGKYIMGCEDYMINTSPFPKSSCRIE